MTLNPDMAGKTGWHPLTELDKARRAAAAAGMGSEVMSLAEVGYLLDQAHIGAGGFDGTVYPFSPYDNPFIDPADLVRAAAEQ